MGGLGTTRASMPDQSPELVIENLHFHAEPWTRPVGTLNAEITVRGRVSEADAHRLSSIYAHHQSVEVGRTIPELMRVANEIHHEHGFWDEDHGHHTNGTKLGLLHCEASEVIEAARLAENPGNLGSNRTVSERELSTKIPEFTAAEEELADVVIRVLDFAQERKCRLFEAIMAKLEYNRTREHMHGKQF